MLNGGTLLNRKQLPADYPNIHAFFYKNNFIRATWLKFAQKLRTSYEQLRLGIRCKFNCKILLKNTTHPVIICGVLLQIIVQL